MCSWRHAGLPSRRGQFNSVWVLKTDRQTLLARAVVIRSSTGGTWSNRSGSGNWSNQPKATPSLHTKRSWRRIGLPSRRAGFNSLCVLISWLKKGRSLSVNQPPELSMGIFWGFNCSKVSLVTVVFLPLSSLITSLPLAVTFKTEMMSFDPSK